MSDELAGLLQAGRVRVFGPNGAESWRMRGLDVIHGEVHLTVAPVLEPKPVTWAVVVVGDEVSMDSYAAPSLQEAIELANLDRGMVVTVYEVEAPDAGAARLAWRDGKRLFQVAWLGS